MSLPTQLIESPPMTEIIAARGLTKVFRRPDQGEVYALKDFTLSVKEGSFVALVGPSGCGKSTVLNMVTGLMPISGGELTFRQKPIVGVNREVGYVTQQSHLFPWLSLEKNVTFPLEMRGVPKEEQQERLRRYIAMVGLEGFEKHYPYQLSGGMQKRAAIIRTMIYEPQVILMDEPFGALDAQTRMIMQDELLRIWGQQKQTILFVTHDLVEAIALADHVVVVSRRPGRVKGIVHVKVPRPRNVFEIHESPGYHETYHELWELFKEELFDGRRRPG